MATSLNDHALEDLYLFIDENLHRQLLVKELADHVHLSPFHFARMFKLAVGKAPHSYVVGQRIQRAKSLL